MASDLLSGMLLAAVLVSLVGAEVGTLPKMEHVNETVFLEGLETCDADVVQCCKFDLFVVHVSIEIRQRNIK